MSIAEDMRVCWWRFGGKRTEGVVVWVADDVARVRDDRGKHWLVDVAKLRPVERPAPPPPRITRPVDRDSFGRAPTVAVPKAQLVRDRSYLDALRDLRCAFCGAEPPSECSHHGLHGVGTKPSDHEALPSCRECHDRHHRRGRAHRSLDDLTREQYRARLAFMASQYREMFGQQGGEAA